MIRKRIWLLCFFTLLLAAAAAACGPGEQPAAAGDPTAGSPAQTAAETFPSPAASETLIQQWAVEAEASSEFSVPEWSADKATGAPDAPGCGDTQFAWASAASDSIATLTLRYPDEVIPREIIIHQSYNPDQVVKVEVFQESRQSYFTVLQKNPQPVDRPCPYRLSIPVEEIDFPTQQVRITVDQSQLGLGWNEIDAVELVGLPD